MTSENKGKAEIRTNSYRYDYVLFLFLSFVTQAGPRMCLGKDASYLQMKISAALLLRFFRFELVPNHPVAYRMMPVMLMKHGLKIKFSRR